MANMATDLKAVKIADKLSTLKAEIEQVRATLKDFTTEEELLKGQLLAEFEAKRIKSIPSGGFIFTRAIRSGYEIIDEESALNWAKKENCIAINKVRMAKMLKGGGALPKGIEFKETPYISVSSIKGESEE